MSFLVGLQPNSRHDNILSLWILVVTRSSCRVLAPPVIPFPRAIKCRRFLGGIDNSDTCVILVKFPKTTQWEAAAFESGRSYQ